MPLSFLDNKFQASVHQRDRVVSVALLAGAIGIPALTGIFLLQTISTGEFTLRTAIASTYTLSFIVLWAVSGKLGSKVSGTIFLGLLLFTAFTTQLRAGPTVSSAALQLMVLILAALIFSTRGIIITLALNLLGFALAGYLLLEGIIEPTSSTLWDPLEPSVWVRAGIILTFYGAVTAIAVTYTVSLLRKETENAQLSLEREKQQRIDLENARQDQVKAKNAMVEAQRIESLGRLASGVAHDFNNSLTIITSAAEMAQFDPELSEKSRNHLNTITKAALQAADMTGSLLALARKDPSQTVVVEARTLVLDMMESISRLLPEDIALHSNHQSQSNVEIDRTQLERAILNFVVNARDAIKEKGEIEVGCSDEELVENELGLPAGRYVRFWVRDNGSGMPDSVKEKIFEPFYTTKSSGAGSGMGMALAQSFVSEANGCINVNSTEGVGTTISIYLPVSTCRNATSEVVSATREFTKLDSNHSILVVEDNLDVLASTSATLEHAGFSILQAPDGDAAMEIVRQEESNFDLLCIDGVIPGASSAEVIDYVQRKNPDIRIVVCSGYVEEELVLRGIRTGELAYVGKPYLGSELVSCIRNELGIN